MFRCPTLELGLQYDILSKWLETKMDDATVLRTHIDSIATLLCDVGDGSKGARRKHDLVVVDKGVLIDTTEDITP
jgi:hypothetical protein